MVDLTIVVQEQGLAEIKRIANAVSDPSSPIYGQYLSADRIAEITAPTQSDMQAVTQWLDVAEIAYTLRGVSNLDVTAPVAVLERLLATKFHVAVHAATERALVKAGDYDVPDHIDAAIATIFGLHGLPVPRPSEELGQPSEPADVTPAVIYSTYNVVSPKVTRSPKNRQAVAEFQGQFMNSTDLVNMFKRYVKDYKVGVDDVITNHHGAFEESSGGIEAELDIQYIMGVSPGIQTEFWEFPGRDFGMDLNMWTSNLTAGPDTPLVHSVSYGWQGNLSQIGVKQADVDVVDANFAKLAAKGISIMISSGDSGSGYAESSPCEQDQGEKGVGITGKAESVTVTNGPGECCERASQLPVEAWTFAEWAKDVDDETPVARRSLTEEVTETAEAPEAPTKGTITLKKAIFHCAFAVPAKDPVFASRDIFQLTGKVTAKEGGTVKAVAENKTVTSGEIVFAAGEAAEGGQLLRFNITGTFGHTKLHGIAEAIQSEVFVIEWRMKGGEGEQYVWEHGPNPPPPPPPPPPGTCTAYKTGTKTSANSTTFSAVFKKAKVQLWPSWPASSPWVTSVGATRFIGQKVGNPEMATDQFGSGGGFSSQFDQTDAQYQAAAVAKYLSTVEASTLPPAGSFPPLGRATPDVSALGEGFQVVVHGTPMPVGGTSASSPTFAGLVSLLNEARLDAGKPAMGFLNPFLYKNEAAFFDVTVGSNKVSRGGGAMPYGFNCSAGWDPATGLGTPLFGKLMAAAMA
jgi:hypothetical protein